jgi:flagellar assembly protein FliH
MPWQMASLDTQHARRKTGLVDELSEKAIASAAIELARDEGYRRGLEAGFSQGHVVGEAKSTRHNQEFDEILSGLRNAVVALDKTIADELLGLALELARQVVRSHIASNPDAILPVIREALNSVISIAQHPRLVLHPDDAELVKREMVDELATHNCRIACDESIARGGLRIDDDSFEIDAELSTRWARTIATLGLKDDWLG